MTCEGRPLTRTCRSAGAWNRRPSCSRRLPWPCAHGAACSAALRVADEHGQPAVALRGALRAVDALAASTDLHPGSQPPRPSRGHLARQHRRSGGVGCGASQPFLAPRNPGSVHGRHGSTDAGEHAPHGCARHVGSRTQPRAACRSRLTTQTARAYPVLMALASASP